jgi:hypothetical protein
LRNSSRRFNPSPIAMPLTESLDVDRSAFRASLAQAHQDANSAERPRLRHIQARQAPAGWAASPE